MCQPFPFLLIVEYMHTLWSKRTYTCLLHVEKNQIHRQQLSNIYNELSWTVVKCLCFLKIIMHSYAMYLPILYVTKCNFINSFVTKFFLKWKTAMSTCPLKLIYKPWLYFTSVFKNDIHNSLNFSSASAHARVYVHFWIIEL